MKGIIDLLKKYTDGKKNTEKVGVSVLNLNRIIKALEKIEQRWIPVSERLPEQPYGCLVTIEDEEPMTGQWFENILPYFVGWDGERWNDAEGKQCPFEVIAWMPLTEEPYKAESEDKE